MQAFGHRVLFLPLPGDNKAFLRAQKLAKGRPVEPEFSCTANPSMLNFNLNVTIQGGAGGTPCRGPGGCPPQPPLSLPLLNSYIYTSLICKGLKGLLGEVLKPLQLLTARLKVDFFAFKAF